MALSTMTQAPWTILSSRAATASGLCRPSAFGMYVRPRRLRPIRSPVDLPVEVLEMALEFRLVVLPCHSVYTGCGLAFERKERRPECVDVEMVEKRGEPLLLLAPCGLPYAAQRLDHALPALRPVRALLIRVSLGPCPWLHRLRRRRPGLVRQ